MRTILLNSAEAVFAPFFDPALAELADWTVDAPGAQGLRVTQSWAFVIVNWERASPTGSFFACTATTCGSIVPPTTGCWFA